MNLSQRLYRRRRADEIADIIVSNEQNFHDFPFLRDYTYFTLILIYVRIRRPLGIT